LIEGASWRSTGRQSRMVGWRRKPKVDWKAPGRSGLGASPGLAGRVRKADRRRESKISWRAALEMRRKGSRRLDPPGRAEGLIGDASQRSAGRQRRRETKPDKPDVEFEGEAGGSVEDASRRSAGGQSWTMDRR